MGLRVGEYTISEIANDASSGYILPDDQVVTVTADDTVIVEMYNEFITKTDVPSDESTPKTGADNIILMLSFMGIALSLIGFAVYRVGYSSRSEIRNKEK